MCACEDDRRCIYHAEMLASYQAMWKALDAIRQGRAEDPGVTADLVLDKAQYRHL